MARYAGRYRAARAFADLTQQQVADALGLDVQTVKRRESGDPDVHKAPKRGERIAFATICGVPPEFVEEGFGGAASSEMQQTLAEIRQAVTETRAAQTALALRVAAALTQRSGRGRDERGPPDEATGDDHQ